MSFLVQVVSSDRFAGIAKETNPKVFHGRCSL